MNKSILLSLISIFAVVGLVGGLAVAFYTSSATSSNNSFASGTLELWVDDNNETTAVDNTVTGSITATDFKPGQSTSGFVSLHNQGSLPIAEVELTADTSETTDPSPASDLASVLNLTIVYDDATPDSICAGGTDHTSAIDTAVGNGTSPLTLAEFDNGVPEVYDAFPGLAVGETRNICFTAQFDSNAENEYQGDSVSTTFTFTANQETSQ